MHHRHDKRTYHHGGKLVQMYKLPGATTGQEDETCTPCRYRAGHPLPVHLHIMFSSTRNPPYRHSDRMQTMPGLYHTLVSICRTRKHSNNAVTVSPAAPTQDYTPYIECLRTPLLSRYSFVTRPPEQSGLLALDVYHTVVVLQQSPTPQFALFVHLCPFVDTKKLRRPSLSALTPSAFVAPPPHVTVL